MSHSQMPKGVGYWGKAHRVGSLFDRLPRPQALVRPGWHSEDLPRIAEYLRRGGRVGSWCGIALCRFEGCGRPLGSTDLTDGTWIWPSGLEHYLLEHSVYLPEEFIRHMASRGWCVPPGVEDGVMLEGEHFAHPFGDLSTWVNWAEAFTPEDAD